jgi:hypothetical protein
MIGIIKLLVTFILLYYFGMVVLGMIIGLAL